MTTQDQKPCGECSDCDEGIFECKRIRQSRKESAMTDKLDVEGAYQRAVHCATGGHDDHGSVAGKDRCALAVEVRRLLAALAAKDEELHRERLRSAALSHTALVVRCAQAEMEKEAAESRSEAAEKEAERWRNLADGKGLLIAKNEGYDEGLAKGREQREKLAALCHEQWSGWMKFLFSKATPDGRELPQWAVDRWSRQATTPYENLSEEEKESDRKEADRILAVLVPASHEAEPMTERWLTPDGLCAVCKTDDLHEPYCKFGPKKPAASHEAGEGTPVCLFGDPEQATYPYQDKPDCVKCGAPWRDHYFNSRHCYSGADGEKANQTYSPKPAASSGEAGEANRG